uniref:Transposase Tc1-like domain-containing protein n=1 Tax=Clytia hemisphaerica TaxID=252671 RepID=A0A7M5XBU0_9CNID
NTESYGLLSSCVKANFTIKRVKTAAGVQNFCDETVRKVFRKAGLRYTHSGKKGVLKRKDLHARLEFARRIKRLGQEGQLQLWLRDIALYLDSVGFAHKYNSYDQAKAPQTMAWRRPQGGLDFQWTARGSHEETGCFPTKME